MKTHLRFPLPILAACVLSLTGPGYAADKVVCISAAASLGDVLKVINTQFEKQTGITVELNLGASNALARQIEEGAPVDVFFSADLAKMDALEKLGRIESSTKEAQLSNAIVVVVPTDSALQIHNGTDLGNAAVKKIAVGDPKVVPAGIYAKQWLTNAGLWFAIEPKLVPTESVRAALAAVEAGNVEAGIVYKTDAAITQKVKIALEVSGPEAPQIIYPMALVKEAPHAQEGRNYLEFLDSKEAAALFQQFGFIVLPEGSASK